MARERVSAGPPPEVAAAAAADRAEARTEAVRGGLANANSVAALKAQVTTLTEAVENLTAAVQALASRR